MWEYVVRQVEIMPNRDSYLIWMVASTVSLFERFLDPGTKHKFKAFHYPGKLFQFFAVAKKIPLKFKFNI